jgi:hypothetical protein
VQDLPVAIAVEGALGAELAAWAESVGWQVVAMDGALTPRLVLATAPLPGRDGVVVVADGPPGAEQVREALQAGAVDVVGWPADRDRLLALPGRSGGAAGPLAEPRRYAVAGAAGGVGASTVALAVGGLLAWAGRDVVVVGGDDLLVLCGADPWRGPGATEVAALDPVDAGAEVPHLAQPVPGVPRLRVLGGGALPDLPLLGWPCDVVVLDLRAGGGDGADLVVARPDAHLAAAALTPARTVLVGEGALGPARVRAALGGRPAGHLPASARVARAGAAGRVPAGLPGTWLAALRRVLGTAR